MKDTPLISIVIPAYNAENYLPRCLESILNQTYTNLQIIIVDDKSTDKTVEVAKKITTNDSRVQIIENPENLKQSQTRNIGLEKASGKYVMFIDADDYIENNLIESAVNHLNEKPADALFFGFDEQYYDQKGNYKYSVPLDFSTLHYLNQKQLRKAIISLEEKTMYGYPWNKFYSMDRIRSLDLKFESFNLIEDILFNIAFFQEAESVILLPGVRYHYQKKLDDSVTNKFVANYFDLQVKRVMALWNQHDAWNGLNSNVRRIIANFYMRYLISALQRNHEPAANMNFGSRREFLKNVYASEEFILLAPYASSSNPIFKVFLTLMKRKQIFMPLMLGFFVYLVKAKTPVLFGKLKKNH